MLAAIIIIIIIYQALDRFKVLIPLIDYVLKKNAAYRPTNLCPS